MDRLTGSGMIIKKRISYSCYQVKQNEYFFPPTLLSQSLLMFFMQAKRSYYFDNFGENDLLTADNTNEHVWPLLPAHCLIAIGVLLLSLDRGEARSCQEYCSLTYSPVRLCSKLTAV